MLGGTNVLAPLRLLANQRKKWDHFINTTFPTFRGKYTYHLYITPTSLDSENLIDCSCACYKHWLILKKYLITFYEQKKYYCMFDELIYGIWSYTIFVLILSHVYLVSSQFSRLIERIHARRYFLWIPIPKSSMTRRANYGR